MKPDKRDINQISLGRLATLLGIVSAVAIAAGTLISLGADKTNIIRDVAENTQGRIHFAVDIEKMEERHAATEVVVLEMKTDFVEAVGDMKIINAEFKGEIKAVQSSLDTLNAHLKRINP